MKRFHLLAVPLCMILFAGCIQVKLPNFRIRETKSYELPPQSSAAFPIPVEILPFQSDSPTKFKMVYRNGNALRENEFGKWAQTPPMMLTRFFREAFPNASGKNLLVLKGKILTFEADEGNKKVNLNVSYSISKEDKSEILSSFVLRNSMPMKNLSAEEYAEVMRQALIAQVNEVKRRIQEKFPPKK